LVSEYDGTNSTPAHTTYCHERGSCAVKKMSPKVCC
jgi:hypothetical protein